MRLVFRFLTASVATSASLGQLQTKYSSSSFRRAAVHTALHTRDERITYFKILIHSVVEIGSKYSAAHQTKCKTKHYVSQRISNFCALGALSNVSWIRAELGGVWRHISTQPAMKESVPKSIFLARVTKNVRLRNCHRTKSLTREEKLVSNVAPIQTIARCREYHGWS